VDETNGGSKPVPKSGGTILIVDDEEAVRDVVSRTLRQDGFEVLTAGDFNHALCFCREHKLHLLIVDGRLPEPGVRVLADVLCAAHPRLKALVISGTPADRLAFKGVLADAPCLLKPFALSQLSRAVAEILGAPAPSRRPPDGTAPPRRRGRK
jgi:DNA-binding NtrC family response regulator